MSIILNVVMANYAYMYEKISSAMTEGRVYRSGTIFHSAQLLAYAEVLSEGCRCVRTTSMYPLHP